MNDYELVGKIMDVIVQLTGLRDRRALTAGNKIKYVSHARDTAIWLARNYTHLSVVEIGKLFKREHSSITCACRRENLRLLVDVRRKDGRSQSEWHVHIMEQVWKGEKHA